MDPGGPNKRWDDVVAYLRDYKGLMEIGGGDY